MKKFVLLLMLSVCTTSFAEYPDMDILVTCLSAIGPTGDPVNGPEYLPGIGATLTMYQPAYCHIGYGTGQSDIVIHPTFNPTEDGIFVNATLTTTKSGSYKVEVTNGGSYCYTGYITSSAYFTFFDYIPVYGTGTQRIVFTLKNL